MFVKVKQTRHTKIGTLRPGLIYDESQFSEAGKEVIAELAKQEPSPIEKMTKAEVDKEKAAVSSLDPKFTEPRAKRTVVAQANQGAGNK